MYKVIITAGGTSEKIDNVRKITNSSSGKLGSIIATKILEIHGDKIDKIYYVCGKNAIKPIADKIEIIEIFDTKELELTVRKLLTENNIDYFVHLMAVSDYTVDYVTTAEELASQIDLEKKSTLETICKYDDKFTDDKISSSYENLIIKLKPTPKIISIIKDISPRTYLVGFKLLDNVSEKELIDTALKLKEKNKCDLVCANDLETIRQGLHKAFVIKAEENYSVASGKENIANKIIEEMFEND